MGYFSNGTEGEMYQEKHCDRCIHGDDPCPVMDLHLLWNYDAMGKNADETKRVALNLFIPRKGIWNDQCTMFKEKTK